MRWNNGPKYVGGTQKMANVTVGNAKKTEINDSLLTPQQLEQIMKMMSIHFMKNLRRS